MVVKTGITIFDLTFVLLFQRFCPLCVGATATSDELRSSEVIFPVLDKELFYSYLATFESVSDTKPRIPSE